MPGKNEVYDEWSGQWLPKGSTCTVWKDGARVEVYVSRDGKIIPQGQIRGGDYDPRPTKQDKGKRK